MAIVLVTRSCRDFMSAIPNLVRKSASTMKLILILALDLYINSSSAVNSTLALPLPLSSSDVRRGQGSHRGVLFYDVNAKKREGMPRLVRLWSSEGNNRAPPS